MCGTVFIWSGFGIEPWWTCSLKEILLRMRKTVTFENGSHYFGVKMKTENTVGEWQACRLMQ